MAFNPKITFKEAMFVFGVIVAGVAAYYTMKGDIAGADEKAEEAQEKSEQVQKLSAANTSQIFDLKGIVTDLATVIKVQNSELTAAIKLQNSTLEWQYKIQEREMGYLKERLGNVERRTLP